MKTESKRILFALVAFAVLLVSVIGSLAIETNYELNQGSGSFPFLGKNNAAYLVSSDFEGFGDGFEALIKDYRTTAPNKVSDETIGDYYYSEMNQKYSVNEPIEWNFTFEGSGHNGVSSAGFSNYTFICDDASLSEDSVVASVAKQNLNINVVVKGDGGNDAPRYVNISAPENTLEPNQTYYLYMTKDCYCKSGTPFNCAMVFKFETTSEETEPEPSPELVSSEGNELLAGTYTDLELKNAPGDDYLYKFIVYNELSGQWYMLQNFDDATTFRWYTGPKGKKNLYVDIKNKKDETDVTRVELKGVNVADYGLKATLAIDPTGELAKGTHATLTATATGGEADYEYKFIVYNDTSKQWYLLKNYGPESTFDWYTGPVGTKTLYVDVKDANGVVVRAELNKIVVS